MIVYISIGNSDDKLGQARWAQFTRSVEGALIGPADQIHGNWRSLPDMQWQNACWCIEFYDTTPAAQIDGLRDRLRDLAARYGQDSISWAEVSRQEMLGPPGRPPS